MNRDETHTYGKITIVGMSKDFADAFMGKLGVEVSAGSKPCLYCGADPGEACTTKGGRFLDYHHQARKGS